MEVPRHIYRDEAIEKAIFTEGATKDNTITGSPVKSVTFDKGIFVNYEGAEFPQKGLSTPEILSSLNIMKAIFIEVFRLRPTILSFVQAFNRIGNKVLGSHLLKDEFRTAGTLELGRIIYDFVFKLTKHDSSSTDFALLFTHLIEYDNAYRLRIVDIATETSKRALLKYPRKELKRLFKVIVDREIMFPTMEKKYKSVLRIVLFALLIPKVRKAFKFAVYMADWDKMVYDDIDTYWACLRTDYNFMGMTYEARQDFLSKNCLKPPVQMKYKVNE